MKALQDIVNDLDLVPSDPACDFAHPNQTLCFEWLRPDQLVVDPAYQRLISRRGTSKIKKICKTFDWRRFGALQVAEIVAGETYAILDGQHRAIVASLIGASAVPCLIVMASQGDQAATFVGINTERSSVASIDKFRARVTSGDPQAVTVHDILTDLKIDTNVAPGTALAPHQTRAVSLLEKLVKSIGRGLVFTTLEMLLEAQPDQKNLLTSFTINATALATARVIDAKGDIDRLAATLEDTDFETLRDNAAQLTKLQGSTHARHGAELLMRSYNKNLRASSVA